MSAKVRVHKCTRCNQRNEYREHAKRGLVQHGEVMNDAPYAFAGYCSAICQALDLRTALIESGQFLCTSPILKLRVL